MREDLPPCATGHFAAIAPRSRATLGRLLARTAVLVVTAGRATAAVFGDGARTRARARARTRARVTLKEGATLTAAARAPGSKNERGARDGQRVSPKNKPHVPSSDCLAFRAAASASSVPMSFAHEMRGQDGSLRRGRRGLGTDRASPVTRAAVTRVIGPTLVGHTEAPAGGARRPVSDRPSMHAKIVAIQACTRREGKKPVALQGLRKGRLVSWP